MLHLTYAFAAILTVAAVIITTKAFWPRTKQSRA